MARKKKAKAKVGQRRSSGRAKKKKGAKKKTHREQTAQAAAAGESPCTTPYCEFYCIDDMWHLSSEDHEPGSVCPMSSVPSGVPPACREDTYSCSMPESGAAMAPDARQVPVNTGDYVLRGNGKLLLVRARYHPPGAYFCPPTLTIAELRRIEPLLGDLVQMMHDSDKFVSVTINVPAIPVVDQFQQSN